MSAMTDRELLELSAKAAGLTVLTWNHVIPALIIAGSAAWNPLTDDGCALRLAVKLGLLVDSDIEEGESDVIALGVSAREPHGHNPCAATRRAIVRAAAAIGAKS